MQISIYIEDRIRNKNTHPLRFYVQRYPSVFSENINLLREQSCGDRRIAKEFEKKQERVMYDLSSLYVCTPISPQALGLSFSPACDLPSSRSRLFLAQQPLPQLLLPTFEVTSRPFRPSVTS